MRTPAFETESSYASGGSPRQRAVSAAIAIVANLLLVLMLLRLAGIDPIPRDAKQLTVFGIQTDKPSTKEPDKKAAKPAQKVNKASKAEPAPAKARARPAEKSVPFDWAELGVMKLSRNDYAASDIGKITPSPARGRGQSADASASGSGSDTEGAGFGPNGQKLYNAEWVREPSDAELATYVGNRATQGAWAEIACRTAPRYHVEDCVELRDYPGGTGLAGAIRQAAFQFLVRPPRLGGKTMVGEWVRIRISFSKRRAEEGR